MSASIVTMSVASYALTSPLTDGVVFTPSTSIPAYAVRLRDGTYVKDRDGNYVVNAPRP